MGRYSSITVVGALAGLDTVDTAQIDDDAVTYAKVQNVAADDVLLGRISGADGIVEEITKAQALTLLGVEADATADQTGAEIKTAYEAESDTNAYNDAAVTKLSGITTGSNTIINSGTYTGNNSQNRAIAHGLGVIPKAVRIVKAISGAFVFDLIQCGYIHYGGSITHAVTAKDTTNFYVGNSGNYPQSANASTAVYYWVAMG